MILLIGSRQLARIIFCYGILFQLELVFVFVRTRQIFIRAFVVSEHDLKLTRSVLIWVHSRGIRLTLSVRIVDRFSRALLL